MYSIVERINHITILESHSLQHAKNLVYSILGFTIYGILSPVSYGGRGSKYG